MLKKVLLVLGLCIVLLMYSFYPQSQIAADSYFYPHHINISWETAPENSQSVNWRTHELQKESYVEYLEARASPFFKDQVRRIMAESDSHAADDELWNYHSVNLTGLKSNTLYSYRVGNGNFWSEWSEFRKAGGDQEAPKPYWVMYTMHSPSSKIPTVPYTIRLIRTWGQNHLYLRNLLKNATIRSWSIPGRRT